MNNRFNKVFPLFDLHNPELSFSTRIIDTFSSCFSFHLFNKHSKDSLISHSCQLDNLVIVSSKDPSYTLIVTDTSIKFDMTTSVGHIHIYDKAIVKTLHYIMNITSTEAKLFAIKCDINQVTTSQRILKIIVITNLIHSARRIFDSLSYLFQLHATSILSKLRKFFTHNPNNSIEFWECPSQCNWSLYKVIDKETKALKPIPLYPCKLSWSFSKKSKYNNILSTWKIIFQSLNFKEQQFLELYNDDNNPIEPSYTKGGLWLMHFSHSNLLFGKATRMITNHTSIGEYRLRFFSQKDFSYLCSNYSIRHYIYHKCRRYNEYWNLRRDMISHFILFLEFNYSVFAFTSAIT